MNTKLAKILVFTTILFLGIWNSSRSIYADEAEGNLLKDRTLIQLKAYLISLEDIEDPRVDMHRHLKTVEKYIKQIERTPEHQRKAKIQQIKKIVEESVARKKRARKIEDFEEFIDTKNMLTEEQKRSFVEEFRITVHDEDLNQIKKEADELDRKLYQDAEKVSAYIDAIRAFDRIDRDSRMYYEDELMRIWLEGKDLSGEVTPYFNTIQAQQVKKGGKPWQENLESPIDSAVEEKPSKPVEVSADQQQDQQFEVFLNGIETLSKSKRNAYLKQIKSLEGEAKIKQIKMLMNTIEAEDYAIKVRQKQEVLIHEINETLQHLNEQEKKEYANRIREIASFNDLDEIKKRAIALNQRNESLNRIFQTSIEQIQKSKGIHQNDKVQFIQSLTDAMADRNELMITRIVNDFKKMEGQKQPRNEKKPEQIKETKKKIKNPAKPVLKREMIRIGWQGQEGQSQYRGRDGQLMKNKWVQLDGKRLFFNEEGLPQSGLSKIGQSTYYFDSSKGMITGWFKHQNKWFYFTQEGAIQGRWSKINNIWYYFNDNCEMVTGWHQVKGKWYFHNSDGKMLTGWLKDQAKWYYLDSSGAMTTGWKQIKNQWYYFKSSGSMVVGWQKIDNKWYYMESSGAMVTGWKFINHKWYYLKSNGVMATGWQKINNTWYELNHDGSLKA